MRSRLICSLASAVFAMFVAADAHAETTRLRISIDDLPLQDQALKVAREAAVLPNGARHGGAVPKSWREQKQDDPQMEGARCTDGRLGSVRTIFSGNTSTSRIWEGDGKTWLDRAEVGTYWGKIDVKEAERVPLARITEGLWGYRRKSGIVLVAARDTGFREEGGFYECTISETEIAAPAGTAVLDSSPKEVNEVIKDIAKWTAEPGKAPKWHPEWTGVEWRMLASVSQASNDARPMLNLVIKKP